MASLSLCGQEASDGALTDVRASPPRCLEAPASADVPSALTSVLDDVHVPSPRGSEEPASASVPLSGAAASAGVLPSPAARESTYAAAGLLPPCGLEASVAECDSAHDGRPFRWADCEKEVGVAPP